MSVINEFGMPFNDVGSDRLYSANDWQTYFNNLLINGVAGDVGSELSVAQQTVPNKTVKVNPGAVFVNGAIRQIDTALSLAIPDNTSGNPRIDRIIARFNNTDRKIEFVVKQGTPAASPSAPALTQTADIWEESLAKIAVANGFSSILTANITDERTFMTYRDRVLNDRMTILESDVSSVDTRMDAMDNAKHYGKYSQMSGGAAKSGSAQNGILSFATEDNDDFSAINIGASNSRITIPLGISKAKFYIMARMYSVQGAPAEISLYKNGLKVATLMHLLANGTYSNESTQIEGRFESLPINCTNGDYFEIYVTLANNGASYPSTLSAGATFGMEVLV